MNETRRHIMAERAEYLRKNMTPCERRLWFGFLAEYQPPFRAQKVVGNYILDFYCHKARLCIEIDGDSHFTNTAIKYDNTRSIYLEMEEIEVLRFTNTDIYESFEGVCEVIHQEVQKRRNDIHSAAFTLLKSKR